MTEEKKVIKVDDIRKDAENRKCPVEQALYYVAEFLSGPMCGKCFPCSMGCYEARIILSNIVAGSSSAEELANLKGIAEEMLVSSMCKKGKDSAKFMLQWLDTDVFDKHLEGLCPEQACTAYIEYRIIPEKCTSCGDCLQACTFNAIHGEKKKQFVSGYHPFEIRQGKCTKCGECINVCPENAIVLVNINSEEPVEV